MRTCKANITFREHLPNMGAASFLTVTVLTKVWALVNFPRFLTSDLNISRKLEAVVSKFWPKCPDFLYEAFKRYCRGSWTP